VFRTPRRFRDAANSGRGNPQSVRASQGLRQGARRGHHRTSGGCSDPIPVTPDLTAGAAKLTADEKAAFDLIPEQTPAEQAQAEQDARARAKLVAKAT
jgi:hypothetical protein